MKKSATHEAATLMTKEAGKSNAKRADMLQAAKELKLQHALSCKGRPSVLKKLLKEAQQLKKKQKKKE